MASKRFYCGMLMWLCIVLCEIVSKSTSQFAGQYECTVRKKFNVVIDSKYVYLRWAGVILNSKFVLSADVLEGRNEYSANDLSIEIHPKSGDRSFVGPINRTRRSASHSKQIDVSRMWIFDSLLLLKMKEDLKLTEGIRGIDLPDLPQYKKWKNTFAIPNNKEFTTSYWYREKAGRDHHLKSINKFRRCPRDVCYYEDGLIPGCQEIEQSPFVCILRAGGPLIYQDMLVGIRKYTQTVPPQNEFPEDYFINVAFHTKKLLFFMRERFICHE